MDAMDTEILAGRLPADPGPSYTPPPWGASYYGDRRREGLDHDAASRAAARDMGTALASAAAVRRG